MFPIFLLIAVNTGIFVAAFEITSYSPRTNSNSGITLQEGEALELWCNVDDWWEWCTFTHTASSKSCELDWKWDPYNVTVLDCADFEGRFEYLGDYNNYKCGVRFKDMRPDEGGKWQCNVEEYNDGKGTSRGSNPQDNHEFHVEVQAKTTTTTTTTTTTATTASVADTLALARNATSTAVIVAVSSAAATNSQKTAVALVGLLACGLGVGYPMVLIS